jgi:hypothetical protein
MFNSESLQEKWAPVIEHAELPQIKDGYRKAVTALVLENQEKAMAEERSQQSFQLYEAAPANATSGGTGAMANWDPILISLVRRAMPNLMAYDIAGVQPMSGPTGLIFAMKSRYADNANRLLATEALFNEANTGFSGTGTQGGESSSLVGADADSNDVADPFGVGAGMDTGAGEALGTGGGSGDFAQMAFSIEKATVSAKTRALKAEYTMELAQDLKAVHGLDAESELANILSAEILAEINREVIRTINVKATLGAKTANVTTPGIFDLTTDADGRWSAEKFKGMLMQIEREANAIAKATRRGKGNFIVCSSDVASALAAAGVLDYTPALATNLNVDDTGNTFAGVLNGRTKVYIDPYATTDYINVGYRGTSAYDAGLFYCPYVPLTMVRAVGENSFQPKIGFKTRYGMVANPFAGPASASDTGDNRTNTYYRIFRVDGLMDQAAP